MVRNLDFEEQMILRAREGAIEEVASKTGFSVEQAEAVVDMITISTESIVDKVRKVMQDHERRFHSHLTN